MKQNWIFLLFEIGKTDSHDPDSCKFPSFFSKILLEHSREPNRKVSIYTHANIIYACEWTVFAFCYTYKSNRRSWNPRERRNPRVVLERKMGGCFSDVRGGKQAVGVGLTGPSMSPMPTSDATLNDAVDHFFRARGLHQLFTQVEVVPPVHFVVFFSVAKP